MSGPVSQVLEQDVLMRLRHRGIVVWLDADRTYTRFVDELCARRSVGDFPFPVVAFRGSFLELLFELEPFGSGLEKQALLIHMPGFNTTSVRTTPVLELYEASFQYQKGLDTLIGEAAISRVPPSDVAGFLSAPRTLDEADAWLATAVSQNAFGIGAALQDIGPRLLVDALGQSNSRLAEKIRTPDDVHALRAYVHTLTGMDDAWVEFVAKDKGLDGLERVLAAIAAWTLSVEYVHDLRRPPHLPSLARLRALSQPIVKACTDLAVQFRRDHGDAYVRRANEVEGILAEELQAMSPEDLGQIDTFREEENRVLEGAVEALRRGEWSKARTWSEARQGEKSFWLQRDQTHRWAWSLVAEAATFGEILANNPRPFEGAASLEQATDRYVASGFEVDRAHRRFEQMRLALLESRLPHFGALREVLSALRNSHRGWADALARDWAALCTQHGFLPGTSHQQRTLFEQVVHPLTLSGEKVAIFIIDAFRFEMATELVDELKGTGTTVDLKARLAELPSITSVGMNALAPVTQGDRLVVAGKFGGFKTGEFTVSNPKDRARAMGMRSVGKPALLLKLSEVCDANTPALTKQVKPHALVVVHSRDIDDAGEANVGLPTFESSLRQITAAWHHLQQAGVKQFVFTADHGFLLQDETTVVRTFGTKRDPQRRHILDEHPRAESGMVNVSLSSLGYEGLTGYLLFHDDTAVFATGNPGATFVHGGNSPQERIIPVLTVTRKRIESSSLIEYAVEVKPEADVIGLHRIRLRIVFSKGSTKSLGFAAVRHIDLSLRVPDRDTIRVVLKDVVGPAELRTGGLKVPLGDEWTEVFFSLEGPTDERVRIEVHHPGSLEKVQSAAPDHWYSVSGARVASGTMAAVRAATPVIASSTWADAIADEAMRRVFVHIEKHGAITEGEITQLLGSPRAFRKFSLEFDVQLAKLPFRIRVEPGDGGKRYVREGVK